MEAIFKGLRVIELANVLAGPSVGQFFAELGAEVIKIEHPITGGDVTRNWRLKGEGKVQVSSYFSAVNSGKKSISLDFSNQKDLSIFYKLVAKSNLILASYKKGDAEKLKVDYQTVKEINPQIIYGSITGYGQEEEAVGYDAIIQAETGFMSMNGFPGADPLKMPVALVDVLAAHHLKEAVLLAYIHLLKTNAGSQVTVSLFDAAVSSLANQATNFLISGHIPQKMGTEHPNIAPYGTVLHTQDEVDLLLAVGTNKQFIQLCKALNAAHLIENSSFSTNENRVKNRVALNKSLKESAQFFHSVDLMNTLKKVKVPVGKIQNVEELFNMEMAKSLVLYQGQKAIGLRNFVAKLGFSPNISHITPPPQLNADYQYVLSIIEE